MANFYVNSVAGSNTAPYDTWAKGALLLTTALAASAAGDTIYVANDHVESTAANVTLTSTGTSANPSRILCVNRAGSVPPVSADLVTTFSASVSATSSTSNITLGGVVSLCHGIIFTAGDLANTASFLGNGSWTLNKCSVRLGGSNAGGLIRIQGSSFRTIWIDTEVRFAAAGQGMFTTGESIWRGALSTIGGATLPNTLFTASVTGMHLLEGIDLSPLASKTLMTISNAVRAVILVKDCKLPATMTRTLGTAVIGGGELVISCSNSGAVNTTQERYDAFGSMVDEATITRTGGANDGTNSVSWKFSPSASCKPDSPMTSSPIIIWNDAVGSSKTVTMYGYTSLAAPTQDDVWIEAEYHGSTLTPIGLYASSGKADTLATPTALTTDTSTWGGSTTTKFRVTTAPFTPQMKGYITIRVKIGAASGTIYIDPKPVIA